MLWLKNHIKYGLIFTNIFVLVACGNNDNGKQTPAKKVDPIDVVQVEPQEPAPTLINSTEGCAIDADCATGSYCFQGLCGFDCSDTTPCQSGTCNARGQCGAQPVAQVAVDYKVLGRVETIFEVDKTDDVVQMRVTLDKAPPAQGIPFRLTRDDAEDSGVQILRTKVEGKTLIFEIPTGHAKPGQEMTEDVRVDITSSIGSWTVALVPKISIAGQYVGAATIDTFGSTGMPLSMEIITQPMGATLADAEKAWLVLPIREDLIFSPARGENLPDQMHAPLEYDDFTKSWVARFDARFVNNNSNIISFANPNQIGRQIRIEINDFTQEELFGLIRDRWTGLYDERSADGVISPAAVTYTGTFYVRRDGFARASGALDMQQDIPKADSQLLPAPALDDCMAVDLSQTPEVVEDAKTYTCTTITDATSFAAATPEAQASCAVAFSKQTLSGDTTSKQISAFLNGTDPGTQSFSEFMTECAAGTNGACRPSNAVLCARQLLSRSYRNQTKDTTFGDEVIEQYTLITRESFLGRQFGAYQTDVETRLKWLQSSDYPALVTTAVQDLNEQLLQDWQTNVLDVHFQVLRGQFDTSGLSVIARAPNNQIAVDQRLNLLMEMSQSYQSTLTSLTLATQRWDTLFIDANKRKEKAAYVATKTRDVYLLAGILTNVNRASNAGFLSGSIGAGFAALSTQLGQLSRKFNELIYARDAEVVINTSVDPTTSNKTLLGDLEKDATDEIKDTSVAVTNVLDEDQTKILTETQLRNKLKNDINDLRNELVLLCGLPEDCSLADLDTRPECTPRVEAGECGFRYTKAIDQNYGSAPNAHRERQQGLSVLNASPSEAGKTILTMLEATKKVSIAKQDYRAHIQRTSLLAKNTDAHHKKVITWLNQAESDLTQLDNMTTKLKESGSREFNALVANIAERQKRQKEYIAKRRTAVGKWYNTQLLNKTIDMAVEAGHKRTKQAIKFAGDQVYGYFDSAEQAELDAIPNEIEDPYSALRLAIRLRYAPMKNAVRTTQKIADSAADLAKEAYDKFKEYKALKTQKLVKEKEVDGLQREEDFQKLQEQYDVLSADEQGKREDMRDAMQLIRDQNRIQLAINRETTELDDRRTKLAQEITKTYGLRLHIAQAKLQIHQRAMDYAQVVQRAQLIKAKLDELERQRTDINRILGSPAAVFARANKVIQAENRLERAKDKLMNWLVALEYYAVRPFMDQRIQILLARNHYQLEEIAKSLKELQNNCGGAINTQSSELSVRADLLNITQPIEDPVSQTIMSPEATFQELLQKGYVPIDKRVRYTTDQSIGDLISTTNGVLAVSFDIDLEDFANLEATCNAKITSIDIQMVGDIGEGRPTVSILYDGTGKLRSCQPGIDAYVEQFGPNTTSFGAITLLRSKGRSISPVAGVNTFGENPNTTLGGLPLASQYTIMINKELGENAKFDWSKLQDIKLKLTYDYQDVFPVGQCE